METLRIAVLTENLPTVRLNLQPWRYLGDLAQALRALGHDVAVVTAEAAEPEWNGVPVERHAMPSDFRTAPALRGLIGAGHFDGGIVRLTAGLFLSIRRGPGRHPSGGRLAGIFLRPLHNGPELARRFLDPRLVPEVRMDVHHVAMYASRLLGTWPSASTQLERFLFLWESDRARAMDAGIPEASCAVVRHPFDPFFQRAGPPGVGPRLSGILPPVGRRIVFSGPPEETRGVHDVVRMVAALPRDPPTEVVLLLRDPSVRRPVSVRSRVGPHDVVVVRGLVTREELRAVYKASHAAVFPYRFVRTGLPLVALEATAAGLPVVTTRVHPLRELEGRSGLVFARPRDPRDVARALGTVFEGARLQQIRRANEAWIRSTPDWKSVAGSFVSALRG